MRNRLIRKFTKCKEGSLGYTLTEMLVVIGIIAVLCAIAIPSVVAISKSLKFAQRNDYAKSIFMAAQANLTEMRADGGLTPLQGTNTNALPVQEELCGFPVEDWSPEYVYTASDLTVGAGQKDTYALVLPVGSVDGTLREQHVIIEYNPLTGNVYSVFYCEDDLVKGTDKSLLDLYRSSQLPRNGEGDVKKRKDMMVGYYDGSGLSSSELEIERTEARITFENGEEGIVTVHIPMPNLYVGAHEEFMKGLEVKLTITGEQSGGRIEQILVKQAGVKGDNCKLDVDGKTVLVTYVLDSLANRMSFANLSAGTRPDPNSVQVQGGTNASLTAIMNESAFRVLPGENVVLDAEVTFHAADDRPNVAVQNATLGNVNPMFGYLTKNLNDDMYTLTVDNGRNLQNLNAIAPGVAEKISAVLFTSDIYWNQTQAYYNQNYGTGGQYTSMADEAPARALPYFVPIHNENLFGTARFVYLNGSDEEQNLLQNILSWLIGSDFSRNERVPTLSDELDSQTDTNGKTIAQNHARIDGGGHAVYYLNINSNLYQVPNEGDAAKEGKFYATGSRQIIDYYFTGLFGYVNTPISDLSVVNPIIKGHDFDDVQSTRDDSYEEEHWYGDKWVTQITNTSTYSNPATGALVGASGYNTYLYNCSVYLDTKAGGFNWNAVDHGTHIAQKDFTASGDQDWYGVSGAGAVGGLVGYAKSHKTTNGELGDNANVLAFNRCFAAVPVSGHLRGDDYQYDMTNGVTGADNSPDKDFGYSNGVGGFIGNSQLTNFYNCYASGNVRVDNTYCQTTDYGRDTLQTVLGLGGNGRTSMGGGGFVGTSHGTRYTNCFSSGNVTRTSGTGTMANAGGFVGMMCYDETLAYGHHGGSTSAVVAQHTVFESCYAVGMCVDGNGNYLESFAGGTGTISVGYGTIKSYYNPDYYRLFAPYYIVNASDPLYQTHYVFKDSYYLSQYSGTANVSQDQSKKCANPIGYSDLVNLHLKYGDANWIQNNIDQLKNYPIDLQVVTSVYNTTRDYLNSTNFIGFLSDLRDIWNILTKSDPIYDFYFTIYDFLAERDIRPSNPGLERSYFNRYSDGFPSRPWETPEERNTHYYGEATAGMVYPFPKLNGLDYYGTWPAEPLTGGLAYYEAYENSDGSVTYGYYFDRADTSSLRSAEETLVLHDGYAVFSGTKDDTIYIFDANGNLISGALKPNQNSITLSSPYSPDNSSYYVTRIPDDVLSRLTPGGDGFYSAIRIQVSNNSGTANYWALFNPNTGISQVNNVQLNGNTVVYRENPDTAMIRSARQLAALSSEKMQAVWADGNITFVQQLHIDAAEYDWNNDGVSNGADEIPALSPIGSEEHPFNGAYTGTGGYVAQARIRGFNHNTALFGYVGNAGSISSLAIEVEGAVEIGTTGDYAAVLAQVCGGDIENVDLTFTGNVTLNARTAAGLLVGYVNGTEEDPAVISGCDITAADLTITAENAGSVMGLAEYCDVQEGLDSENLADDVTLTLTKLTLNATEAGGFLGSGLETNLDGLTVQIPAIDSAAANTGALIGTLDGGSIRNLTMDLTGAYKAQGEDAVIAGIAAVAKNATVQNVAVSISGTLEGSTAAGAFGTALALTVQTTDVTITGSVTGTEAAAGMAASIDGGTFTAASVKLDGTISANGTEQVTTEDTTDEEGNVIPGTTTTEPIGRAAGYAVAVKGQVESGLVIAQNQGNITANAEAAGFACEITAQVTGTRVAGKLTIDGGRKAAGFAVKLSGSSLNIGSNGVTPALENTTVGYLNHSNGELTVTGETAALFAVEIGRGVNVTNCYALGTVTGQTLSGFADVNGGTLEGCTANVTITGGNAFIRENTGVVANSYGWYGNGAESLADGETATVATMDGNVVSSYFADLDVPVTDDSKSVDIYNANKEHRTDSLLSLTAKELNGESGARWFASGTYGAYPYAKLVPKEYPFPMLRVHYGDWSTPPRYAYGVMYYEQYTDGSWRVEIKDLSDEGTTVEKNSLNGYYYYNKNTDQAFVKAEGNIFDNEGEISKAGYAVFFKDDTVGENKLPSNLVLTNAALGDGMLLPLSQNAEYTVYLLKNTGLQITLTEKPLYEGDSEQVTTMGGWFAHEFGTVLAHVVRTEDQLAMIQAAENANGGNGTYSQTHDIVLSSDFTTISDFRGTYNGNNLRIQKAGAVNSWMNVVSGTVEGVDLVLGDLNASFFGNVTGTVRLTDVYLASVGANGSLINTLSGTLDCGVVEIFTLSGNVINETTADLTITVKPGLISDNGAVIGTVSNGTVSLTLDYAQNGDIGGSLANNVTGGTFNLVNAPAFGTVSGNLFDAVSGTVTLNQGVTVGTLEGSLVDTMNEGADVTANAVNVTNLNAPLVRTFTAGTLSGTRINVTNGIAVPVIADTLGGTVEDCTVTGSVTLGGTAKGALVNTNNGRLDGVKLSAGTVTVQSAEDAVVGALVGTNTGDITDCTVEGAAVTITGSAGKALTFGGLVGENSGSIAVVATDDNGNITVADGCGVNADIEVTAQTGSKMNIGGLVGENTGDIGLNVQSNVNITYTQSTDDEVNVGGIVAVMNGGSITGLANTDAPDVTGEIILSGTAADRKYIVGGAVGKDGGFDYTGVCVNVDIDSNWEKPAFVLTGATEEVKAVVSPDKSGPVGQFVGYVATGASFVDCYGIGNAEIFNFLGEVQHTEAIVLGANTYGGFDKLDPNHKHTTTTKEQMEQDKVTYSAEGTLLVKFDVTLTDCYYTKGTDAYKQEFVDTKYYYTGTEDSYTSYTTELVNPAITFTGNSDLTVSSFGSNESNKTLTNWYYKSGDNYYPVWYQYEYEDRWLVKYYGVQLWADTNLDGSLDRFVNISGSDFGNTDKDKKIGVTLYSASGITIDNGKYVIVGGGEKALTGNGAVTNFTTSFTNKNTELASAIWTNNSGKWSQGSTFLNLSGSVTGAENTISISIARAGKDALVLALNGGKYLTYDGAFKLGDIHKGVINLYKVFEASVFEMSFSNEQQGKTIVSTFQEGMTFSVNAIEDESDLPAESGEAPTAQDGNNN